MSVTVKITDNREYRPIFKTLVGWVQSFEVGQRGKNRIRPGPALKGGTNRKARLGRGAVKFGRPAGTHRERHTAAYHGGRYVRYHRTCCLRNQIFFILFFDPWIEFAFF